MFRFTEEAAAMMALSRFPCTSAELPRLLSPASIRLGIATFTLLLTGHLATLCSAADPAEVGNYSRPKRLQVHGTQRVNAQLLSEALQSDPEILWAGHPHEVMSQYRDVIRRRAEIALQHLGLPDARVKTRIDTDAEQIHLDITEGSQLLAGRIKVPGVPPELAQSLSTELSSPRPTPAKHPLDLKLIALPNSTASPSASLVWIDHDRQPVPVTPPSWIEGQPAPCDAPSRAAIREQIEHGLARAGYDQAKIAVDLTRDPRRSTMDLVINISELTPAATITAINITGAHRNSPATISEYLKLKTGQTITRRDLRECEHRLRNSGRFLRQSIAARTLPKSSETVIDIDVTEYAAATPLGQPLNREEQTLLACRNWLMRLRDHGYDLRYQQISSTASDATANNLSSSWPNVNEVLISRAGLFASIASPSAHSLQTFITHRQTSLTLTDASAPESPETFWFEPATNSRLTVTLQLAFNPPTPTAIPAKPFSIGLGMGIQSHSPANPSPLLNLDLRAEPVFFIALAHEYAPQFRWSDMELTITTAQSTLSIDASTGRLIEWQLHDDTATNNPNSSSSTKTASRITTTKNAFQQRFAEQQTKNSKNQYDPNRPITSAAKFLGSPLMIALWGGPVVHSNTSPPSNPVNDPSTSDTSFEAERTLLVDLLTGIRSWAQDDRLTAADSWMTTWLAAVHKNASTASITIPPGAEALAKQTPQRTAAAYLLQLGDQLFERNTWPATLNRMYASFLADELKYVAYDGLQLYQSPQIGPVGCLAISTVAPNALIATRFAQKGSERLSTGDFRRDAQVVIDLLERLQSLDATASAMRSLTPSQTQTMLRRLVTNEQAVRQLADYLQSAARDHDGATIITKSLEILWENGLKQQVAEALRARDPQEARRPQPATTRKVMD